MTMTTDPYTAAWLSEMWKPVHELSAGVRAEQRKLDRETRWKIEELEAVNTPSTPAPLNVDELSTGCAKNGSGMLTDGPAKCA
jgi:hypothetical protein